MLDEAVIYGISMCGKRDINEAEKDLQTVSIRARYITWSQKTQRKGTWCLVITEGFCVMERKVLLHVALK